MEIIRDEHQTICKSSDFNGDFEFRIQNDCSQIQLETAINGFSSETYADVDMEELKVMIKAISSVLGYTNVLDKARKWDALNDAIGKFYEEDENGEPIYDEALGEIGEVAASAFGYL